MLLDVLDAVGDESPAWKAMVERVGARARRYATILERLISPDGTFPPIGRSIAYRAGAFQALAQAALRRMLDPELPPAQVRGALTAVIRRTLDAPGTFDAAGWLRIGLAGHQPGDRRALHLHRQPVPLRHGAAAARPGPSTIRSGRRRRAPWTSQRAWSGQPFPIDHALG